MKLQQLQIFQNLTEEELEYCLNAYGDEDLAVWLCGLTVDEQKQLLEKSARLSETLDYYGKDICRECGLLTGAHFTDNMQYYRSLASCDRVGATNFSSTCGYYYIVLSDVCQQNCAFHASIPNGSS